VSRDVDQTFLGNPVDDQFNIRAQGRQIPVDPTGDGNFAEPGEFVAERSERAVPSEIRKHTGTQPPRDLTYFVEAGTHGFLGDMQLIA